MSKYTMRKALSALLAAVIMPVGVSCAVPQEKTREEVSEAGTVPGDEKIELALAGRLARDEFVDVQDVVTEVDKGVALLEGRVSTLTEKRRVNEIVANTRGVVSIVDRLRVKPSTRSDGNIEKDVKNALRLDPVTEGYEISLAVKDAEVTLRGTVNSWREKHAAAWVAGDVCGVKNIENKLQIERREQRADDEILQEVESCLEMDPYLDIARIVIGVEDGKVTLKGKVGSLVQRERARQDAWVAGVEAVDVGSLEVSDKMGEPMIRREPPFTRSDREIEKAVKLALTYDPRCDINNIDVRVEPSGKVILNGSVNNMAAVHAAGDDVRNTLGVWSVKNHLRVVPPARVKDLALAANVKQALKRDAVLTGRKISALVRNGKVSLYGELESGYLQDRAEKVVSRVFGVVAVDNHIVSNGATDQKDDREILRGVAEEIHFDPVLDIKDIEVYVHDGTAVLNGEVSGRHELIEAVKCAFRGGAKAVRSRLSIEGSPDPYLGYLYASKGWVAPL